MRYNFCLIIVVGVLFSHFTFAAAAKSSSGTTVGNRRGDIGFAGVGAGTFTAQEPFEQLDSEGIVSAEIGADIMVIPRVFVAVAFDFYASKGKVNYSYKDANGINYQGTNVSYTSVGTGVRAGLHLRFVDLGFFHLYGEGGALFRTSKYSFIPTDDPAIKAKGSTYEKDQGDVLEAGGYAEAGIDLVTPLIGFRAGGRMYKARSRDVIRVLGEKQLAYDSGQAFFAVLKEF